MIQQVGTDRATPALPCRRWFFLSTPLRQFLIVMAPIAAMMTLLALLPAMPAGIRVSAAIVAAISVYSFCRGYRPCVEVTAEYVRYRNFGRRYTIPWCDVRGMDHYTPIDRNRTCQYVYITRLDRPPVDWRDIDENTIQLQDRPGLLETLRIYKTAGVRGAPPGSFPQHRDK